VDAFNLVSAWRGNGAAISKSTAQVSLGSSVASIASSGNVTLTATVRSANGGTPLGSVTFYLGAASLGTVALSANGDGSSGATLALSGATLPTGANTITAQYSGDGSYNSGAATVTVTVTAVSSGPTITTLSNGASFRAAYAPGMILSIFGTQLASSIAQAASSSLPAQLAGAAVTINGVSAPVYYASPSQLNVQIPYETPVNASTVVAVTSNGQTTSRSISIAATAPGIFVDQNGAPVPHVSGARGSTITLYITGEGAISPALATGATPDPSTPIENLPKPNANVTVTVGGAIAPIQFIGITWGVVGATQINYQIPADAPLGAQPVVVRVGNVSSPAATLTVTGS